MHWTHATGASDVVIRTARRDVAPDTRDGGLVARNVARKPPGDGQYPGGSGPVVGASPWNDAHTRMEGWGMRSISMLPALMAMGFVAGCSDVAPTKRDPEEPAASAYVGSEACLGCHADKATYRQTGHANMLKRVVNGQKPPLPFTDIQGQLESYTDLMNPLIPGGSPAGYQDVSFVLGGFQTFPLGGQSRPIAMFLDRDGYLFTPKGAPELGTYGFCGKCHTTGWKDFTSAPGDDRNSLHELPGITGTFVAPSVQCEACHGPGAEHAKLPSRANITRKAQPRTRAQFLSRDLAYDEPVSCYECHSTIDTKFRTYPDFTTDYEMRFGGEHIANIVRRSADPVTSGNGGSIAADALVGYDPDTGIATNKMGAALDCVSCHDPHKSAFYRTKAGHEGAVVACTQCHAGRNFNDLPGSTMASTAHKTLACAKCHMANPSAPGHSYHFFKIDLSSPSANAHHFSEDGEYRRPWLRADEACKGCHATDYDQRAAAIQHIHL